MAKANAQVTTQVITPVIALVIAIDGPSGSGKSSVARELAKSLNIIYIDTGAMYRALAYMAARDNIDIDNEIALKKYLGTLNIKYSQGPGNLIEVNGENLTKKIREHHVSKLASYISQKIVIRDYLLDFQRQLAEKKVCVMEGRDIGTVVFPDAFCKFFITASVEIRAKRRLKQLQAISNTPMTLVQIISDVEKRDELDINRAVAPLKMAPDSILIETGEQDLKETVDKLKTIVLKRGLDLNLSLDPFCDYSRSRKK